MLGVLILSEIVRIGVFGLFHPNELVVRPAAAERNQVMRLRASGDAIEISDSGRRRTATSFHFAPRGGEFVLSVPGKIERRFRGVLDVTVTKGVLAAVASMDREVATASAVAAESPPGAGLEALMAQAVVTRSYYAAARGRHASFDFCDTTHCQFLRAPPAPGTPAAIATERTRGLVLRYRGGAVAALFSASCGGRTRALANPAPDEYPYYSVDCPYCRRGPRVLCTYCDPASDRAGHGYGLCQTGAKAMAADGATFREILRRYFPNTELGELR
jgi:peptidoglycan hydrolase-like amidase